ncbi:MAG TPA: heat-inducible transcriptional repressor HrcA [Gammaproteobacteria bacterium]|jgi:heat-inducible transcriptional repressor|nr:heat-inducible transcriptional repressor HrcA [Gammaproteobacteria bacterium]
MAAASIDNAPSERAQHLLRALVERYIRDGQPVGSRMLSRESGMDISPATVRNVMADLEEMGFVSSPHTSAGRVPTVKGYRFFVDTLLEVHPPSDEEITQLRDRLLADDDSPQVLLTSTSNLLSGITRMTGIVTLPRHENLSWRQIEFLPLSENRVLTILVLNQREVQNRILYLDRSYSADFLRQTANYLNDQFAGLSLTEVRDRLLNELRETRASLNEMMLTAINMAEQVFTSAGQDGYVMAGETNLMNFAELSEVERLRRLFEAFNEKRDILHLLDQCISAEGVQIFIGEESGYSVLDDLSVVTAPYSVDDRIVGVLGVIGPTRMAYDRVIPIVDITAKLLGAALKSRK